TGFRYDQNAFALASHPFFWLNRAGIAITKVDPRAAIGRNPRRERYLNARLFDSSGRIVFAQAAQMRTVRQNTPRAISELVPLLHEIIAHVIANLLDEGTMRVGKFRNMRRVNNDLAAIGDNRL